MLWPGSCGERTSGRAGEVLAACVGRVGGWGTTRKLGVRACVRVLVY
uniref:Uncharacterized protein n=1 Tax=Setaria italica TaxID=4555 RepID=K3Y415_SETIT